MSLTLHDVYRYIGLGCPVTVMRQNLSAHEAQCPFGVKPCKYQTRGCRYKGEIAKMKAHEEKQCKFRDITCKCV